VHEKCDEVFKDIKLDRSMMRKNVNKFWSDQETSATEAATKMAEDATERQKVAETKEADARQREKDAEEAAEKLKQEREWAYEAAKLSDMAAQAAQDKCNELQEQEQKSKEALEHAINESVNAQRDKEKAKQAKDKAEKEKIEAETATKVSQEKEAQVKLEKEELERQREEIKALMRQLYPEEKAIALPDAPRDAMTGSASMAGLAETGRAALDGIASILFGSGPDRKRAVTD
jgi:uncharacterized protein YhaN